MFYTLKIKMHQYFVSTINILQFILYKKNIEHTSSYISHKWLFQSNSLSMNMVNTRSGKI